MFCKVARVAEVYPHPNADELDILYVDIGQYVVRRDKGFRVGDPIAIISPGVLVPVDHWQFKFLDDGKRKYHKVRAVNIRGVRSEGLAMYAPWGSLVGDDVADKFGAIYPSSTPSPPPPPELRGPAIGFSLLVAALMVLFPHQFWWFVALLVSGWGYAIWRNQ